VRVHVRARVRLAAAGEQQPAAGQNLGVAVTGRRLAQGQGQVSHGPPCEATAQL